MKKAHAAVAEPVSEIELEKRIRERFYCRQYEGIPDLAIGLTIAIGRASRLESEIELSNDELHRKTADRIEDLREEAVLTRLARARDLAMAGNSAYVTEYQCASEIALKDIPCNPSNPDRYHHMESRVRPGLDQAYEVRKLELAKSR